jgi:hypothetical protein
MTELSSHERSIGGTWLIIGLKKHRVTCRGFGWPVLRGSGGPCCWRGSDDLCLTFGQSLLVDLQLQGRGMSATITTSPAPFQCTGPAAELPGPGRDRSGRNCAMLRVCMTNAFIAAQNTEVATIMSSIGLICTYPILFGCIKPSLSLIDRHAPSFTWRHVI